jgi:hypothetical protein
VTFDGQDAYAVHDYSCVSSVAIFSAAGQKLLDFVN